MNIRWILNIVCSLARSFGIWCVTDNISPHKVVDEAVKKWGNPSAALTHLLQIKSPSINVLCASCIFWSRIGLNDPLSDLQTLRMLLERLPPQMRANALVLATNTDFARAAYILTRLSPPVPSGLTPVAKYIVAQWSIEPRCDDLALNFYQSLRAYGAPQQEIQWLAARALVARGLYAQAKPLLLNLAQFQPSPDVWWHLVLVFQALGHPPQHLLEALYRFITSAPLDARISQALKMIGSLYSKRLEDGIAAVDTPLYLQTLRALLEIFPEQRRAEVLALVINNDDSFAAHILSSLAPHALPGLASIAHAIMIRWAAVSRSDDLALQFYYSLPAYGISQEEAHLLLVRALVARGLYSQAEQLLAKLPPSPDSLWLLALIYRSLHRPPQLQLEALLSFIRSASSDARLSQAWKMIGDLYGGQLGDGMAAVNAYKRAEALGLQIPQLAAFRTGNWDTIPAFRAHPDYVFPVIIALDLEVDFDPEQESLPGKRVFEVAAVRMKGGTILHEYQSYIRRPFRPQKMQTNDVIQQAPEPERVAADLRIMIGESLVIGHNLRHFDAKELDGMGVHIPYDRIIDTFTFARLLYPDSLHHNLALLCSIHGIEVSKGGWHSALPDARACGQLLHALGNELVRRGGTLLSGIRALAQSGGAFDQAVLQPRKLNANPAIPWSLDPRPSRAHVIVPLRGLPASSNMRKVLQSTRNVLVELHDPEAAYIKYLPPDRRSLVTVSTRSRLERMLSVRQQDNDVYVLPDPRTLLCPQRLRSLIDKSEDSEYRLLLFCLYQASHNHDARTLYPMRLPATDDPDLLRLRQDLMWACCSSDMNHSASCSATQAHLAAMNGHKILLATHEALMHQEYMPKADLIVIDDAAELQMHLAEYEAKQLNSDYIEALKLESAELEALNLLKVQIAACLQAYAPQPGYHERIPLHSIKRYLTVKHTNQGESVLTILKQSGGNGKHLAEAIENLYTESAQDPTLQQHPPRSSQSEKTANKILHAHWLDIWFTDKGGKREIERWAFCGISEDPGEVFSRTFWQPFNQHILCGTALTVNKWGAIFLKRSLRLPPDLPLFQDKRPPTRIYIPSPEILPPAGFLRRSSWARQVGTFLYSLQAQAQERTLVVTLNSKAMVETLAQAFTEMKPAPRRQVLTTYGRWTTAKIAERLADPSRSVLALVPPRTRRMHLDIPVDIEATGPLQFLNQQDPLVAAHMRIFADLFPEEGPFIAYLLPQALLELKARLSSNANLHIILDSRLHTKAYRDEVFEMLKGIATIEQDIFPFRVSDQVQAAKEAFLIVLTQLLEQQGFGVQENISDEELRLVLRKFWDVDDFKPFTMEDASKPQPTQKDIVRGVLDGKDQLLIAATGGGKSLCFQLPALLFAAEEPPKVTIVFSPLISLMSDQVESLRQKGVFSAIMINSSLPVIQRQEYLRGLRRGDYSIVYIAPEQIRSSGLRRALEEREIGLIAIDEAHCLSQWGHDFRTDYFAVKDWIRRLSGETKRKFPILALTATARKGYKDPQEYEPSDQTDTIDDIIGKFELSMDKHEAIIASPQRDELEFRVEKIEPSPIKCNCGEKLKLKAGKVECQICRRQYRIMNSEIDEIVERAKFKQLVYLLDEQGPHGLRQRWAPERGKKQRGIVYCAYTTTTERVAKELRRVKNLRVATYYAEMESGVKEEVLRSFKNDEQNGPHIVVATNAFGMGIDVPHLGFVIHFDIPGTPEAYYQEAGRAGRDKMFNKDHPAVCILLYHHTDLKKQRNLSLKNRITRYQIEDVYNVLCELRRDVACHSDKQATVGEIKHEVTVTEQDIATHAGISEEKVGTILYYLEYHATANDKRILERGETAHHVLELKFERGYQQQIGLLPESSPSRPLLDYFLNSDEFGLIEDTTRAIPMKELAENLGWHITKLEGELRNLVQRRIVTYDCKGRICWTNDAAHARKVLTGLASNVRTLIEEVDKKKAGAFLSGVRVFEDLTALYVKHRLSAVPLPQLLHFLSTLSHKEADELRLFKRFARAVRRPQVGYYEMSLWIEENRKPLIKLDRIFAVLQDTLSFIEQQHVGNEQQAFDLLRLVPDYRHRQHIHRQLLLLDMLGLLEYKSDPSLGLALRIIFKPPYSPVDRLEIDLASLRLKETYEKNKLKLMERYATETQKDTRAETFNSYFFGRKPLIEHVDQTIRADLIPEQKAIIKLEEGRHLIEGPAGSGKTTALIEHIKHLVYHRQVPIERIMVTTHFNSARDRIAKELEVLQQDSSLALTTTINSLGERIFKQYRLLLLRSNGMPYYEKEPKVRKDTEKDDQALVSKALMSIYDGTWQKDYWPDGLDLPWATKIYKPNDELENECLKAIRRLREYGIFPMRSTSKEQIVGILGKGKDKENLASLYYAVYLAFLQLRGKDKEPYYTFDDQVLFALAILQSNQELLHEYRNFFEYIIVDELQDFTYAQAQLFLHFCGVQRNVLAFGDRDQEIRPKEIDSSSSVFKKFSQKDDCGPHQLSKNFRSTQQILDLIDYVRNFQEDSRRQPLKSAYAKNGDLPVLLRVCIQSTQQSSMVIFDVAETSMAISEAMIQASLEQMEQIPELQRGNMAFIVPNEWKQFIVDYLRRHGYEFSVLGGDPLYQLRHVDRVLTYLRLIADSKRDDDVERLLRYCVVPYFEDQQVKALKGLAQENNWSLFDVLNYHLALGKANVTVDQWNALQDHLAVIKQFSPTSSVSQVTEAIRAINDGPITIVVEEQKAEEIETVLRKLQDKTVTDALAEVQDHLSFLEKGQRSTGLIVTTTDHAKSEEFDTVFFLGADQLKYKVLTTNNLHSYKRRFYVNISRARRRLFLVVNREQQVYNPLLSKMPKHLYKEVIWSPRQSESYVPA